MTFSRKQVVALGRARKKIFAAHYADLNFTGCGIGYRRRGGEVSDEPVVVAMVIRKRPEASISRMRLLPRTVEVDGQAWGVDVVEAGPVTASSLPGVRTRPQANGLPQGFARPIDVGCGISNVNGGDTGTLGCFVVDSSGINYLLSTSHVLSRFGAAAPNSNEVITQPALADGGSQVFGVATLNKYIAVTSTGTNYVDAATAQLTDQSNFTTNVINNLMAPISSSHPAVGMVIADDSAACGRNSFLCRMDHVTSLLGVTITGGGASAVVAPQVGMFIEKVGHTTGYTATIVDAIGVQIKVNFGGTIITFSDMIWTQGMSGDGDSGAVACQGGTGTTYAPLPGQCTAPSPCALISAFGSYYNLPLTSSSNLSLADELRDHFLAMSNTGQFLIGVSYLNAQTAINRLNSNTGSAHNQAAAQTVAHSLYTHYHDLVAKLIASSSPAAVITSSEVNAVASMLYGLGAPVSAGGAAMLTAQEAEAGWLLFSGILKPAIGMGRRQLIAYMNESTVFHKVQSWIAAVPTIQTTGTISAD